jgi:hypothetical protein
MSKHATFPTLFQKPDFPFRPMILILSSRFRVMKSYVETPDLAYELGVCPRLLASHVSNQVIRDPDIRGEFPERVASVGFGSQGIYHGEFPIRKNLGAFVAAERKYFREQRVGVKRCVQPSSVKMYMIGTVSSGDRMDGGADSKLCGGPKRSLCGFQADVP